MAKKFDWDIWTRKVGLSALAVLIAGGASVWSDNPLWLAIVPILTGIQNYWKNR